MKLNIPIEETIKKRVSVRTYDSKSLSEKDKEKLLNEINKLTNPFGVKVQIHLIEKDTVANGGKLGTYGVIKGAKTFLGVSVNKSEYGLVAAGYQFENLILYATNMGLATVWLAATFSREQFETAMDIKKDELFPAISPIGYAAGKKSVTESLMRKTLKSDKRKPWEKIFFQDSFENPLSKEEANEYLKPLEMLRLAPSATNAQPWKVVKKQGSYHFFESHKKNIKEEEIMIKKVDVGIALSHFHQTVLENGLTGNFEKQSDFKIDVPDNTDYIISWNMDKK
ncbi:nitroreductase family protein [Clostridium estertheticum]|uniref:nitroreductase family protein n=1 Tax=Clostridium estertheticum TaxID=238834 RepID=UPI001CF58F1E|nr:nitroreductase family protein [Clostridium estertheticum]MCB2353313.1 nitroreductase [Clostridium estertheticum]WAG41662.1 nitroreductase [Clostridium estertheticum]